VTDEQQSAEPGAVQGYDAEVVAALARGQDPGLPDELARELAVLAEEHLAGMDEPDAPELARRLLAAVPRVGATPAAVVARAAVQHCREQGRGVG
jgi:hypothetical protein